MIRIAALALALSATPAFAQSVEDQILSQLQAQGFSEISLQRTLLGRLRVIAQNDRYRRELVINPASGEILRDYWDELDDDEDDDDEDGNVRIIVPQFSDDDEDDDERDDDDEDDDDDDDEDDDDDDDDEDDDD